MDWATTTVRRDEKHLCFGLGAYYNRELTVIGHIRKIAPVSVKQRDVNTPRPRQNGRHFADDTFKRIFLNEKDKISI